LAGIDDTRDEAVVAAGAAAVPHIRLRFDERRYQQLV